ncbi:MAG TPA: hypothetical protein VJB62_04060 [Patescibacteria group bacterium]|nr:hypothetical protein [Patescibacteria group bacterium]
MSSLPRKVAILYSDAKRKYFSTDEDYLTEKNSDLEAEAFLPYLKQLGVKGVPIPADTHLLESLRRVKPQMAINVAVTIKGSFQLAALVPGILELEGIPYTGTTTNGFLLGCNKFLIYTLLEQAGIPVPRFQLFSRVKDPVDKKLCYPLILKLNGEHSNVEITREAVVENESGLRRRLKYLLKKYQQDVLISEFIDGRELAAFWWQPTDRVFAVERKIKLPGNKTKHEFMDYDLVWHPGKTEADYSEYLQYQSYRDPRLAALVKRAAVAAKMEDYGKFDIRMDNQGNYYFIDANANCYLAAPEFECELSRTLKENGVPFTQALKQLLETAYA